MDLTVRQVSKYLNLSERQLYRLIERNEIPAIRVHDQYRFNRAELLEWAMARRIKVPPELLEPDDADRANATPGLSGALRAGGVFHGLDSGDKVIALRSMVDRLRLPDDVDRDLLLTMYRARESLASTGIGDGIAIPHVRNPIVLKITTPQVALCFLSSPVDFGAIDGKPVFALFSLVTPTIRSHLFLLSRLGFVLRDPGIRNLLQVQAAGDAILQAVERIEAASIPDPAQTEHGVKP
ncbi:MAG: hypothetical protein A2498_04275 [Lentisphaerae bacterium RIFOXYC12_FULL_60_16]|nr:MAG: hypothetical protein A2498_04275 [Lentisphaerae bacterium RIFOXYC12_FULL_60_16]